MYIDLVDISCLDIGGYQRLLSGVSDTPSL